MVYMSDSINNVKRNVYQINSDLQNSHLVIQNFGNASSRFLSGFVIKPSGIILSESDYKEMVQMDLEGNKLDGDLNPSSDEPTHRVLYSADSEINGVVHTHSKYATAFAQANLEIPNLGTTHSDFSKYSIFVTEQLEESEVVEEYELNTGKKIVETLKNKGISMMETPGILSIRHGVFSWGKSIEEALKNAEIIEYLAELCFITRNLNPSSETIEEFISSKHFNRKHGPNKYYGQ
jgi:L-ribulose-5-phosphate 4-epimerase